MLGYGAAVAIGWLLLLLRQPGVSALDTLWAEDGAAFLSDALIRPFGELLLKPQSGYALVVPRVIAEIASRLPLDLAAVTMSGGSALLLSMLAAFVYRASSSIQDGAVRLVVASSVILLPVAASEATNNATNLHWFLTFAAFWALVWVPDRWTLRLLAATLVAVAGLTDPLTLLLLPMVAMRLLAVRRRADHVVTVAWAAGLSVQLLVVLMAGSTEPAPGVAPVELAAAFGARVVVLNALGLPLSESLWPDWGDALPILGCAGAVLLAVYVATRPAFTAKPVALGAIGVGAAMFVVTHVIRWSHLLAASQTWESSLAGSRYLVVPALLMFTAVALLLGRRDPRIRHGPWSRLRGAVLVWYVAVVATSFSTTNGREDGPSWREALNAAREFCTQGQVGTLQVPITPATWAVTIDCLQLRRDWSSAVSPE